MTNGVAQIVFISLMTSLVIARVALRFTNRKALLLVVLAFLPVLTSFFLSFRDPSNSLQLFVYHSFASLILTTIFYFVFKAGTRSKDKERKSEVNLTPAKDGSTWSFGRTLLWALFLPAIIVMIFLAVFT